VRYGCRCTAVSAVATAGGGGLYIPTSRRVRYGETAAEAYNDQKGANTRVDHINLDERPL